MKRICNFSISFFLTICFTCLLVTSCKTEDPNKLKMVPVLTTTAITKITQNTATTGGNITSDNGFEVSARGVCWNLKPNPTINDSITRNAAGTGEFISNISNLIADNTYYVRAYATNSVGTAYGLQVTFKTLASILPTLSTTEVTDRTGTTATCGGNVTFDGGSIITARGVCWSTIANPTLANNKTTDGNGSGAFTSNLSGLSGGTTYYLRAYATNSVGTAYGNEVSFVATQTVTDIDGNVYKIVTIGTQTWMAENLKTTKYDDGTAIPLVTDATAWGALTTGGYCWYNNDAATNKSTYGALYNWYAVHTAKLAPAGWHVATDAEWTTLGNYVSTNLGASGSVAKALAATTNWASYTGTGTIGNNLTINNSSGFTALPGGFRSYDGPFYYIGRYGNWWSSPEYDTSYAWVGGLGYCVAGLDMKYNRKSFGFSVRCVKN